MEQQLNVGLDQTTPVLCEKCSNHLFEQQLIIRKVSGILAGTGKPSYIPIPVFACTSCGHVNSEFLPKQVKDLDE